MLGSRPQARKPEFADACETTRPIEWILNIRSAATALSHEDMPKWYYGRDVLLCTSANEGTPMPPLEAAATGIPVITTPVGDMQSFRSFMFLPPWHNAETSARTIAAAMLTIRDLAEMSVTKRTYFGQMCRREIERRADWRTLASAWLEFVAGV